MWKNIVSVVVEFNHFQFVHLKVKLPKFEDWVLVTTIYDSPRWMVRKELWTKLTSIAQHVRVLWPLAGDFNALLSDEEKRDRYRKGRVNCPLFQQFCFHSCLKDTGFQGPSFTWNRGTIFEWLDWILCNDLWEQLVMNMLVYRLHKIKSNHRPLAIYFDYNNSKRLSCPF